MTADFRVLSLEMAAAAAKSYYKIFRAEEWRKEPSNQTVSSKAPKHSDDKGKKRKIRLDFDSVGLDVIAVILLLSR